MSGAKTPSVDKITYHPFISKPEFGVEIPSAYRLPLFQPPRNSTSQYDLKRIIKHLVPPDNREQLDKAWSDNTDNIRLRRSTFKHKIETDREANSLDADIKVIVQTLDKLKRDQRLHNFQAKKEDKFHEQAKLLKLWQSENPAYAGQSATAYTAASSPDIEDGDSSPQSFFGRLVSSNKYKYTPFQAGPGPREQLQEKRDLDTESKSHQAWKDFRAHQIERDKSEITRIEKIIKKLRAQQKSKQSPTHSGGRIAARRKTRKNRSSSTRRLGARRRRR